MENTLVETFMRVSLSEALKRVLRVMEHDYTDTISVEVTYNTECDFYEIEVYEKLYSENSHIFIKVKVEEIYTYCEVTCKDGYYITDLKYISERVELYA